MQELHSQLQHEEAVRNQMCKEHAVAAEDMRDAAIQAQSALQRERVRRCSPPRHLRVP